MADTPSPQPGTPRVVTEKYEILLRFCCEIGETAGHLRGVSLEQRSFLVDDKGVITARLHGDGDDKPADFPLDDLQKLLGDAFVAFDAQLTQARAEAAQAKTERAAMVDAYSRLQKLLADSSARITKDTKDACEAALAGHAQLAAACAENAAKVADLLPPAPAAAQS
jgi:hypothetical protein